MPDDIKFPEGEDPEEAGRHGQADHDELPIEQEPAMPPGPTRHTPG